MTRSDSNSDREARLRLWLAGWLSGCLAVAMTMAMAMAMAVAMAMAIHDLFKQKSHANGPTGVRRYQSVSNAHKTSMPTPFALLASGSAMQRGSSAPSVYKAIVAALRAFSTFACKSLYAFKPTRVNI